MFSFFESQCSGLQRELDALLHRVEDIDPRLVPSANRLLKKCEGDLASLESKMAVLDVILTAEVSATPVGAEVAAAGGPAISADKLLKMDLAITFGAMNHGFLSVLRIQQKSQAVGSLIERKYAYRFGWLSLYVGSFLGLLGIALALFPIWDAAHSRKPENHVLEVAGVSPPVAPPRLAIFPIRFSSNAKGDAGHMTVGVTPDKAGEESLAYLIRSLRGCADLTGRAAIRLNVVGFASSAEFKGRTIEQSSALNLDAANHRAREVASLLQKLREADGLTAQVVIETRQWTTFEEMAKHRPFNDRSTAASEHDQEAFNRVVQIEMVGAGSCEPPAAK